MAGCIIISLHRLEAAIRLVDERRNLPECDYRNGTGSDQRSDQAWHREIESQFVDIVRIVEIVTLYGD